MSNYQRVVLHWLEPTEGGREVLPTGLQYSTVSRFADTAMLWPKEAWSLVVEFEEMPRRGVQTLARARFLSPEAPAHLLKSGNRFELLEGDRVVARGQIL
jgi:hypothetical protein